MRGISFLILLVFNHDFIHGSQVDMGRAKAKISAEEMLKLHRKRRDDDKTFSINSRRNEQNKVSYAYHYQAYQTKIFLIDSIIELLDDKMF